ncbi:MAG: hypothetical protein ACRD21_07205 [Vicinamibacteria bacterium]
MKILRAPMVHFLILGAALFFLLERASGDGRSSTRRIVVTRGRIESLAEGFLRVWKRPPTAAELRGLVEEHVKEEVYYREAIAIGLDRQDWFLRQHLRRKLEFLKDDLALDAEPTDEDLETHLAQNREEFLVDGEVPPLQEIRAAVQASWIAAKRREAMDSYYQDLRSRYTVRVATDNASR